MPPFRPLAERYWDKVNKDGPVVRPELGPCWSWNGQIAKNGYGRLNLGAAMGGAIGHAHRVSWEIHNGPVPSDLWVLHRCDNRECSNPEHLFLGTNQDNIADMAAKGRRKGERSCMAKLTESDVHAIRAKIGTSTGGILAKEFGVSPRAIRDVATRRNWRHI